MKSNFVKVGLPLSQAVQSDSIGLTADDRKATLMGAVGQADGIAAALAVKNRCPIRAIHTGKLQHELKNQGALLSLNSFQTLE